MRETSEFSVASFLVGRLKDISCNGAELGIVSRDVLCGDWDILKDVA